MSIDQLFQEGLKSFQAKEFQKAGDFFGQALALDPQNPTLLVNFGLTQFELGQKVSAYVHLKKAQQLNPDLIEARQGLEFLKTQIQVKELPHEIELYEQARSFLVTSVSPHLPLFLLFSLLGIWGYRTVSFLTQKKKSFLSGEDLPKFGLINWLVSLLFIFSLGWTCFYLYDSQVPRGLVKVDSLSARSAPSLGSPVVLELFGGMEIIVLRKEKDWLQIQYPGSFTGWAPKETVLELN